MTDQTSPVTETPVVKSFVGSMRDDRCLEVWFADKVTDATRAWLLEAVNEKALRTDGLAQSSKETAAALSEIIEIASRPISGTSLQTKANRFDIINKKARAALVALPDTSTLQGGEK